MLACCSQAKVLFMYDMLDDVVMSRITEFMGKRFVSLDSNDVCSLYFPLPPIIFSIDLI